MMTRLKDGWIGSKTCSLVETTPGSQAGPEARRYSYNTAGQLVKVEAHDANSYQVQAEMTYNGQGQRLSLTVHQGEQSLTTAYMLDGSTLLAATANGESTLYLPGIGEYKQDWHYYLADGAGGVRQLTDPEGAVTLTRSFTPWGELLEQAGEGNFTWGYLGGVLDAATGLVYVGNGQYYDSCIRGSLTPYRVLQQLSKPAYLLQYVHKKVDNRYPPELRKCRLLPELVSPARRDAAGHLPGGQVASLPFPG
jgi:YD repeat-containing protein